MTSKQKIVVGFTVLLYSIALWAGSSQAAEEYLSPKTVIAFAADIDQAKPQPLWDTVLAAHPDIFLFLGDNVYIDSSQEKIMRQKYNELANSLGYRKLLEAKIPIMATWDDHDFGEDDGRTNFKGKKASQKVFLDFFGEPQDSPRRKQQGIYDAKIFGTQEKRVQIIALDTRYFKSPMKKSADPRATILGEQQWQWLEEELRKPAEVRIIMSSIQVITRDNSWENWMNFPLERARLFDLLKKTQAEGVIFVSGDRHFGELSVMNGGIGYPMYDLTTGSFNKAIKKFPTEKNLYRIEKNVETNEGFALITIDWGIINPPQITLEIKDGDKNASIERKFPLAILKRGVLPVFQ